MHEAVVFLADGFEEIEAVTIIDVLRRGGVDTVSVSLSGQLEVTGAHAISLLADRVFRNFSAAADVTLILPGGGPGTENMKKHRGLLDTLRSHHRAGGRIAAICAAPGVLGMLGLLEGKTACCYPGFEGKLTGARIGVKAVEADGNIITSRSAGTAMEFGLAVLDAIKGKDIANMVRSAMLA
jgi:4-methyl-5(b-hydroxyethyl)-thiazole monophosphate biosynthesis